MKYPHFIKPFGGLRYFRLLFTTVVFLLLRLPLLSQQLDNPPGLLFQGFWWDFRNDKFKKPDDDDPNNDHEPGRWSNYLTELSPRLSALGIDKVWIPPSLKGGSGFYSNGYDGMDHYDLGDKYQKGTTRTRMGTKDELLRMVATMHANGIDVIQDIVLNHIDGAGSVNGAGGIDPASAIPPGIPPNEQNNYRYKNFRYASFETPATDESENDYLSRKGRFFKNWQNFHPNAGHNCSSGDICSQFFGPDVCYFSAAKGTSSNAIYNPVEADNWMYDNTAKWIVWYKKQMGFDGVRLDAVKHFEPGVTNGLMDELKTKVNNGKSMFTVGEFADSNIGLLDGWVATEGNVSGTFDFSLRDAINSLASQNGFYDISQIPGAQQSNRKRTVPFVNNHDTFRPRRNVLTGNYEGWRDGFHENGEPDDDPNTPGVQDQNDELRAHIDPRNNKHLAGAYAIICAVDGTPQIFFDDLFDIGTTNKGLTHDPTISQELPVRNEIANIIWAHKAMSWKTVDQNNSYLYPYNVRTSLLENPAAFFDNATVPTKLNTTDVLVIERSNRALIAINDNEAEDGEVYVNCNFPIGTTLIDYSGHFMGANEEVKVTDYFGNVNIHRVKIKVPAADPSKKKYGYSIWAPKGLYDPSKPFTAAQRETTQEWEMADDLGDSHSLSVQQGGAIPGFDPFAKDNGGRYVGKIFAEAGKEIHVIGKPFEHYNVSLQLFTDDDTDWEIVSDVNPLELKYTPKADGWFKIYVAPTQKYASKQNITVTATYTAPQVVDTKMADVPPTTKNPYDEYTIKKMNDGYTIECYPNDFETSTTMQFSIPKDMDVELLIFNENGEKVSTLENSFLKQGKYERTFNAAGLRDGTYIYRLKTKLGEKSGRVIKQSKQ